MVNQTVAQNKAAIASQRLAKVQDYLATRQERVTLATQKQNAALHQTKNKMNGSNMAVQQLGYQFGDFAVQVQGGTSAFVAFSQQASQLVGILPMVAGPLGLSMGAAVGLSAALGILIPIGSAIGRMFMEMNTSANEAAAKIKKFEDNLKSAKAETVDMTEALRLLRSGFETESELALNDALVKARDHLREMLEAQKNINAAAFESASNKAVAAEDAQKDVDKAQEALDLAREDARVHREAAAALQKEKDRQKRDESVINQLVEARKILSQQGIKQEQEAVKESKKRAKAIYDAVLDHKKLNASAEQELDLLQQKNVLLDLELQYGKDSSVYKQMALGYEEDNLRAKLEAKGVDETIIAAQIEALLIQKGITQELADQLALKNLQAQFEQKPMGGRGGDPRKQGGSFIDWNTIEATKFLKDYEKNLRKATKATEDADKAAEALRKELEAPMVKAIDSVSNAFGDFIADGLKDFKSFAKSIVGSFKSMISQMIATAARNKIMLSLGMGGSGFAASAAAGQVAGVGGNSFGGPLGSMIGSFGAGGGFGGGTGLLGGIGGIASGMSGIFSGGGLGASFANLGGLMSGSVGGMGAIGAALPALGAVAVVIGLLSKKTKLLDSGLRTTIEGFDVAIETFKKTQSSRLFGLLKSRAKTGYEAASAEVADPLIEAIGNMQQSIIDAAGTLGIGAGAFDDFSYQFKLSLKGLTEEEQLQKINEEITKMGDSFASLTGIFDNMNDLLAVAQQRLGLETQLLQMQGDIVELRRMELETVHVLNRDLAARIQLLQAEGDLQGALGAFAAGISEQQSLIRRAVDALVAPLVEAIDRTRTQAEKSYQIFRTAADKTRDEAENIVDIITGALESRTIRSEAVERMRYTQAQQQLASFAGGASFDEASLSRAVEGVSIDTTKFFGSFEDYARDFYKTQISLTKLAEKAEGELTDVEKQIDIAEKAYQVAMGTYQETVDLNTAIETLAEDLNIYEATKLANEPLIKMVQDEGNRQIELLDNILVETTKQVNALLGIETSMADLVGTSVSIGEAMGVLGIEANGLSGGVLALGAIEKDIEGNVTDLGLYVVDLNGSVLKLDTGVFSLTDTVDALDGDITTLFESINLLDGGIDDFGLKVDELGMSTDSLGINVSDLGTTLANAMSGLGSIVSGLSGAVSGLAASNNALASAQASKAKSESIASTTANAAEIAAALEAVVVPEVVEVVASKYRSGFFGDKASTATLSTGEVFSTKAGSGDQERLNAVKLAQDRADELNLARNAPLAEKAKLEAELEAMRQDIRDLGGVPTFASGGMHSGGMRLVGERGPELEVTGPSRIYSAQQTKSLMSGGSGEVVVELRSLRREVSELKSEQRKVGVENVKYNKKSYDLYREWDTIGLPATRTS